eukprot:125589-Rhodomonas_salina.1
MTTHYRRSAGRALFRVPITRVPGYSKKILRLAGDRGQKLAPDAVKHCNSASWKRAQAQACNEDTLGTLGTPGYPGTRYPGTRVPGYLGLQTGKLGRSRANVPRDAT